MTKIEESDFLFDAHIHPYGDRNVAVVVDHGVCCVFSWTCEAKQCIYELLGERKDVRCEKVRSSVQSHIEYAGGNTAESDMKSAYGNVNNARVRHNLT